MDALYFIFRYIPFWSIPLLLISGQFFYIYWLKDYRRIAFGFAGIASICFFFLVYYLWAGSPDNSAKELQNFLRMF